jgi:hypothetical protein
MNANIKSAVHPHHSTLEGILGQVYEGKGLNFWHAVKRKDGKTLHHILTRGPYDDTQMIYAKLFREIAQQFQGMQYYQITATLQERDALNLIIRNEKTGAELALKATTSKSNNYLAKIIRKDAGADGHLAEEEIASITPGILREKKVLRTTYTRLRNELKRYLETREYRA